MAWGLGWGVGGTCHCNDSEALGKQRGSCHGRLKFFDQAVIGVFAANIRDPKGRYQLSRLLH